MTAGDTLIVMRLNQHWTVLHVSIILAGLILTLNADSDAKQCDTELTVPPNRVYEAELGEDLKIHCLVSFCEYPPPTITWLKREDKYVPVNVSINSHIKVEWKRFSHTKGKSILIFQNIRRNDSGTYSCQSEYSIGHLINVSVCGEGVQCTNSTQKNETRESDPDQESTDVLWTPVYFAIGLPVVIILVITVTVLSLRGCAGKPKKQTQSNNQHVAVALVEEPSSRRSPPRPKCRTSQPNKLPRDGEVIYSQTIHQGRGRGGTKVEEEASSIVYAALNHQCPARAAVRPPRPKEESSEYAAIRVSEVSLHVGKR